MKNIKLTKEQQQYLILGVLMLGGFGYSYIAFFWMPVSQKIKDTSAKIQEIEDKIERATRQAARLPRLEQELVRLNEQADEAERRLPKNKSVPDILVTLSEIAEKHRVSLQSFTPGPQTSKQFFIELNYPMIVRGSYHNLGKFFAAIALEDRIFNIMSVQYGAVSGDNAEMTVTFTLLSYQYKG